MSSLYVYDIGITPELATQTNPLSLLLSPATTLLPHTSSPYAYYPVQPLRSSPVSYSLTTPDEYGVNHAVLTFDTPNDARTYLLDLLAHTDDERLENAIRAELDDLTDAEDS
jgi:hypothetical protein